MSETPNIDFLSDEPLSRTELLEHIARFPIEGSPSEMRERFRALTLGRDASQSSHDVATRAAQRFGVVASEIEGGLRFEPPAEPALRPARAHVVWFHGGGYVFGEPSTHARSAACLAARGECVVSLHSYPLAPGSEWPEQRAAALEIVRDVRTTHQGPLVLAGDSAGGHLALVTALNLGKQKRPPAGLLLFAPNTDRSGKSETRVALSSSDPMNDDAGDAHLASLCFGERSGFDLEVSPLLDDLSVLPRTHIEVGDPEVLLDDSRLLVTRASAAGVSITAHIEPEFLHMGQLWAPRWEPAVQSLSRAAAFVRSLLPTTR